MSQAVNHSVEEIFEAFRQGHPFDFQRQSGLFKKLFVMPQGIMVRMKPSRACFSRGPFYSRFQFYQRPDRLANGHEASAGLEDAFGFAQNLDDVRGMLQDG